MRALIAIAVAVLPMPAVAQTMEDAHNNLFADHSPSGSNGAHRIGARIDNQAGRSAPAPMSSAPLVQPANSGIRVYQPHSLNDVARDWAKAHPKELPNHRKPDPQ
ncbi:hypothetical protein HZF05_12950 [Sphingomonas sp. CGMCC 1.13654]|uniref:Uncharacterized protein n=1 Tax=Sphingomonas chungangi TaxID=2683589 RepID=A0A838LA69_9SPHN|nr:hypothetical protein [Sphingomonas chungangi]MBA2935006.1 hypothetical protein [Sphingomonas chungangi]MVW54121.1 hypothetical protein [Sphingomonas chungangi]